jgi:hypothetical protein
MSVELMSNDNWLRHIPFDIFQYIFEYCGAGTITIVAYLSNNMATYIMKYFSRDEYLSLNLCWYGVYDSIDVLKWGMHIRGDDTKDIIKMIFAYLEKNATPINHYLFKLMHDDSFKLRCGDDGISLEDNIVISEFFKCNLSKWSSIYVKMDIQKYQLANLL